MLILLNYQLF